MPGAVCIFLFLVLDAWACTLSKLMSNQNWMCEVSSNAGKSGSMGPPSQAEGQLEVSCKAFKSVVRIGRYDRKFCFFLHSHSLEQLQVHGLCSASFNSD